MADRERRSMVKRVAGLVAGVGALGLLLGGVATATIPTSTTGQVAACYRVSGGALRVIDVQKKQRCVAGERLLTWGPSYVWRGAYNPKLAYAAGSVVVVSGSSYVARVAVPKGRAPSGTGTSYWGLMAAAGGTAAHTHDDRYYTKAEGDARYPGRADVYTKAEGDARYPGKAELLAEVDALKAANATQDAYIRSVLLGTATVPSGQTVTGYGTFDHSIIADNEDVIVAVQLPGKAATGLDSAAVNFAVGTLASDDDATCTGTVASPTAPPGKVCLYLGQSLNVDDLSGFNSEQAGFEDQFFLVRGRANGAPGADLFFRFSWAYRAP